MTGDDPFLIGRDDPDFNAAIARADARGSRVVGIVIDGETQPVQPLANTSSDVLCMLADSAGEDQAIQTTEAVDHHRRFPGDGRHE